MQFRVSFTLLALVASATIVSSTPVPKIAKRGPYPFSRLPRSYS
jgi:hypothetical protein